MEIILTIGITSYKRIDELSRCIKSIKTKYNDKIEVLVSEDHSPLSDEIKKRVKELSLTVPFPLVFSSNPNNLGYDMNLGAIIKKAKGKYVFLLSDDDAVFEGSLDGIIERLLHENGFGVVYSPFAYHSETGVLDRNHKKTFFIEPSEKNASRFVYDSILFSGLIFKKEFVDRIDASVFKNFNYFQVYLFLLMIYKYGGLYMRTPSVVCIGDGENAYGISESSGGNELLANRKSVISNLEFNKTLIKTIKKFDQDYGTNVFRSFEKQYSMHSYSGLYCARQEGKEYFKSYWKKLKTLDLHLGLIAKLYYVSLYLFGTGLTNATIGRFKRVVKK